MLTTRLTPKISDRPADRKKSDEALARPFKAWSARTSRGRLLPRAQLPHFGIGGLHRGAIDVLDVGHRRDALLDGDLAHPGAHGALVIDAAVGYRPGILIHLQIGEGADVPLRFRARPVGD